MRVDLTQRHLKIGVRDLVGRETARWDIPFLPKRAEMGRAMHQRRRKTREAQSESVRSEVHLNHTLQIRDFSVEITGRLDGLLENQDGFWVEEFKSVAVESYELSRYCSEDVPAARLQLGIYLYLLHLKGYSPLHGVLVLGSVFDPSLEYRIELSCFHKEVERHITLRVLEMLEQAESLEAWKEHRRQRSARLPFPHATPRAIQSEIGREIRDAFATDRHLLLEAPTGVGKTAATLHACLQLAFREGWRVFFVTAKTSGQAPVLQALQHMRSRGADLSAVVLTAREKVCRQPVVYCHPDFCSYAQNFEDKVKRAGLLESLPKAGLLDRTQLEHCAEEHLVCPFELSLSLTTRVDVVVADYNYVFDPKVVLRRLFVEEDYHDWLLIIDEAHNLVPRAREYYSPTLSWKATRALESWGKNRGDAHGQRVEYLTLEIQRYLWNCLEECGLSDMEEGRAEFNPDVKLLKHWQTWLLMLLLDDPLRRTFRPLPGEDEPLLQYYRQLAAFAEVAERLDHTFTCFVERLGDAMALRITCHDAAPQLAKRLEGFRGVVAMSATLSPPEFYRNLLGFPVETPLAQFGSPFKREHRGVFIVADVPDRFRTRYHAIPQIAAVVKTVMNARRGVYVVFAPSFEFLSEIRPHLEVGNTEVFVQDPRVDDRIRQQLLHRIGQPREVEFSPDDGRLLLAVLGGSFAEGIEWAAGVLTGVIILGPGLPKVGYEQEMHKRYCEDQYGQGFEYAYLYPGMARVIQAAGRLIRRKEDRGVIVLVGERFAELQYYRLLPKDWYQKEPHELVVDDLKTELDRFWSRHA